MSASRLDPAMARQLRVASALGGGDLDRFATGHAGLDGMLGGGLARARLHEVCAPDPVDAGCAAGFGAMLALRAERTGQPILWLRTDAAEKSGGGFYAPGFAELGGDPAKLFLGRARDAVALLRAACDATRCAGLSVVVAELGDAGRHYDLTASRRLTLAAEASGATLLMLRVGTPPTPSAAETRWGVRSAPSQALEAGAPGSAMLEVELLRWRAGPAGGRWTMEWDRDRRAFAEPALSGAVVPVPAGRALADRSGPPLRRAG